MKSFVFNSTLQDFLKKTSDYNKFFLKPKFDNLLVSFLGLNDAIFDIIVFDSEGKDYSNYCNPIVIKWFNNNIDPDTGISGITYYDRNYLFAIKKPIFEIGETRQEIGYCMFVINTSYLRKNVRNSSDSSIPQFYILDSRNTIIAGPDNDMTGKGMSYEYLDSINLPDKSIKTRIYGREHLVQKEIIKSTGWKVVSIVPVDTLMKDFSRIRAVTVSMWIICVLLLVSVVYMYIRSITYSTNKLLYHMESVKKGNLHTRVADLENNEFNVIAKGFNEMMDNIVSLNEKNLEIQRKLYELEIHNRQSKLLALQSQINPHFLYNTLDCMKSMGIYYKVKEIQETAASLAHIFRYSIKGETIVKISEEVQSVRHYLRIQQIRFMDKFEVEINISEQVMNCTMLKFLLQPIVENAIYHGLEPKQGKGLLSIRGELCNDLIRITTKDNGAGMDQETLDAMMKNMNTDFVIDISKLSEVV